MHVRLAAASIGVALVSAAFAPLRAADTFALIEQHASGASRTPDVVVSPDGLQVYVAHPYQQRIVQYGRDPGSGLLTEVAVVQNGVGGVDGLDGVRRLAITPDAANLIASSAASLAGTPGEDALTVFSRDAGTGLLTQIQVLRDGVGGVEGLHKVYAVVVAPDGEHVYLGVWPQTFPARGPIVFERDASTGLLTFVEVTPASAGMPSTGIAISPDGAHLYAVGPYEIGPCCPTEQRRVVVASRNLVDGTLTVVQNVSLTGATLAGFYPDVDVAVSADGRNVYVPGSILEPDSFDPLRIAVFARDATTGTITPLETGPHESPNGEVTLTPDDTFLVASFGPDDRSDYVAVFGTLSESKYVWVRDPRDGTLALFDRLDTSTGTTLAMAPDGAHFYAGLGTTTSVWQRDECEPLWIDTKSVFNRVIEDLVAGDDTFVLKGKGILLGVAAADLDLDENGLHFGITSSEGDPIADVTLGAGTYAGTGTAGWKQTPTAWVYVDTTATPVNGVNKVLVKDLSAIVPGMVALKIVAKRGGTYAFDPDEYDPNVTDVPRLRLELGAPTRCLQTGLADCKTNGTLTKLVCKALR